MLLWPSQVWQLWGSIMELSYVTLIPSALKGPTLGNSQLCACLLVSEVAQWKQEATLTPCGLASLL